jgi:hypothetical protein
MRKLNEIGLSTIAESPHLELCSNRFHNHRRNLYALADFQQGASTLVSNVSMNNLVRVTEFCNLQSVPENAGSQK